MKESVGIMAGSRLEQRKYRQIALGVGSREHGYVITDSIQIGETEFVFGKLDNKIPMYVTWACKDGNNYYWGHYFSDPLDAKKDLLTRAGEELEFQMERRPRAAEKQPKEPDKRER